MTHHRIATGIEASELARCSDCHHAFTYPRGHCPKCGSQALAHSPVRGQGTVYTVTVVRAHPDPHFHALTPYAVAYLDLEGGGRILARLDTPDPTAVRIGDRVDLSAREVPVSETESAGARG